jgi:hypothetical protein
LSAHAVPAEAGLVPQQPSVHVLVRHAVVDAGQSPSEVQAVAPPEQAGVVVPVELADADELVVVGPLVVPPPEPPVPGILLRSTRAMSSQPVELAASALAAIKKTERMLLRLLM